MTLHFAAARTPARSAIARALAPSLIRRASGRAANDNGELFSNRAIVDAALRHFAKSGMAAANDARRNAETAMVNGDYKNYVWWLEICRSFDRGQARHIERIARKASNW
jgi:hypothetical protein